MIKTTLISLVTCIIVCGSFFFFTRQSKKTVYVDTGKLFAEFKLSKELASASEEVKKNRQQQLDSLYEKVRSESLKAELSKPSEESIRTFNLLREEFLFKQQQFDEENKKMTFESDKKIWNQLNQYIADYGEAHKYIYVLGANGQGNIMYANKENNITEELITYINSRYEDKNIK
jgi:Skp family chaperone for outer membrane proteins